MFTSETIKNYGKPTIKFIALNEEIYSLTYSEDALYGRPESLLFAVIDARIRTSSKHYSLTVQINDNWRYL